MQPLFTFGPFPRLETERLVLREITWGDVNALYALFSDPAVTRYNDVQTFCARADAETLFHFLQERYRRRIGLRWGIARRDDDPEALIGTCGYNTWNRSNNCGEIGYDLIHTHWNQGYMTEVVREIVQFGFARMHLNRIEADVMVPNDGSARVLQKVGFTEEGILRQRGYWKGEYHDLRFFSLLRGEFDQSMNL